MAGGFLCIALSVQWKDAGLGELVLASRAGSHLFVLGRGSLFFTPGWELSDLCPCWEGTQVRCGDENNGAGSWASIVPASLKVKGSKREVLP